MSVRVDVVADNFHPLDDSLRFTTIAYTSCFDTFGSNNCTIEAKVYLVYPRPLFPATFCVCQRFPGEERAVAGCSLPVHPAKS